MPACSWPRAANVAAERTGAVRQRDDVERMSRQTGRSPARPPPAPASKRLISRRVDPGPFAAGTTNLAVARLAASARREARSPHGSPGVPGFGPGSNADAATDSRAAKADRADRARRSDRAASRRETALPSLVGSVIASSPSAARCCGDRRGHLAGARASARRHRTRSQRSNRSPGARRSGNRPQRTCRPRAMRLRAATGWSGSMPGAPTPSRSASSSSQP